MSTTDEKSKKKPRYHDLIDQLQLDDFKKDILKQRWADQTVWHGKKSREAKTRMNIFRVIIIVGGLTLPALAVLPDTFELIITTIVSLTIAVVAGLEGFFKYAEKHSQYRETAEILKIEGWSYFACTGVYKEMSHEEAFSKFTQKIETILRQDVRAYVNLVQDQIQLIKETPTDAQTNNNT